MQQQSKLRRLLTGAFLVLGIASTVPAANAGSLKSAEESAPAPLAAVALRNINGTMLSLDELRGKVVLLDFWASWCGPCRESFPWMNRMQETYREQGLEVIGVNLDQEPHLARTFLKKVPAKFTVLLDSKAQLPEAYGLVGMPSSYLIDREGRLRASHTGFHASQVADYEATLKQLLAE